MNITIIIPQTWLTIQKKRKRMQEKKMLREKSLHKTKESPKLQQIIDRF